MLKECINLWKFYSFCLWCGDKIKADEVGEKLLIIYKENKFFYYIGKIIVMIMY